MKTHWQNLHTTTKLLFIGLLLVGCNSSSDGNTQSDDPGTRTNPPTTPGAFQAVVYSSNAIELAWQSAEDNGAIAEYQIYRDGTLVATQNTLRFFEDDLAAGTTFTYLVLAVDDEGNSSDPAKVVATTLDEGPIVSGANYSVILPYVFNIANGQLIDDILQIVNDTDASWLSGADVDNIAGLTLVDQAIDATDVWRIYTYDCEFGGNYQYHKDTFIQFGGHFKGYYDECRIGSNSISGDFDRKATVRKDAPYNEVLTSQYDVTLQNDELGSMRNFTGQIKVDNSQVANKLSVTEASYYEHNLLWSTTISGLEINVQATDEEPLANYAEPFSRSFNANFHIRGPQTGDETLAVNIAFSTDVATSLNYQAGYIEVTAEDGSNMKLNLAVADLDTFQLTFSYAGTTTSSVVVWSDDYRLLCLQKPMFDMLLNTCE